ncbi:hypothetical protein PDQ75_24915 [Bacillus cereus group sp. Bc015]|uniref:hypothetical protein n=1 Tax=Bacillus cereus group sp. Bc015 TaxID=3018123 RepID=UPI0022E1C882|nr:hypothetical protein [Bacillus cereus group sp. Bc015]MDA2738398.1 hypothetical protein [Bacillus cereus group sp. Bc015]
MMNQTITVNFEGQVFTGKVVNVVGDTVTMMEETSKQFFDFPVSMVTLKDLTILMVAKLEMENRYSHLSCFDYPKEYQQMEDLNDIIFEILKKYNDDSYSNHANDLYENIKDIAIDVINGNIDIESAEISYYTLDDWVEIYVKEGLSQDAKEMFESLFLFMDKATRNQWLEGNHLSNFTNTYSNIMLDYILMVNE